jgi:hypothetical protein
MVRIFFLLISSAPFLLLTAAPEKKFEYSSQVGIIELSRSDDAC